MNNSTRNADRLLLYAAACGLGLLLVLIGIQHYWLRDLKYDDAWIHFRYSENIARGNGFVFNEGEKVLGSGGVLWNLLLAGLALIMPAQTLSLGASVLNYLALLGCVLVLWLALRGTVPSWLALVIAGAVVAHGPLLVSSIGGMETVLLCLLYFLSFWALARERYTLAAVFAGAAVCFRVESLALMAATWLATWIYRRRETWRALGVSLLLPLIVYSWTWIYFGSPVANSTRAKSIVYTVAPLYAFSFSVDALLQIFPFYLAFPFRSYPETARMLGFLVWLEFMALGFYMLRRRLPAASLVAIQVVAAFLFYTVTNPLMFQWYYCTFVPLGTVLAILGMVALGDLISTRAPRLRYGPVIVILLSFSIPPLRAMWTPFRPPSSEEFSVSVPNARENARTYQYANIARWLNRHTKPADRVCIAEVGAFGYHYKGRVLDGMGLISPEILPYHPLPNTWWGPIPPQVVRDFRPEFLVSMDHFGEAVFADPWFRQNYELIGRWPWFGGPVRWHDTPPQIWGSSEIFAYRRRDIPWNPANSSP